MKTNYGLAQWAKDWLGMPYWYGCVCYKCTGELLERKAAQYSVAKGYSHYVQGRMSRYRQDIAGGKWAADCIGLAKGYMWWDGAAGKARYATNACPDMSADGMYEAAKVKGKIGTLPELSGIMLHKRGHAGVYIGDGWAIEERGFNYGCERTRVEGRGWDGWYQLPGCTYMQTDNGSGREHPPFDAATDDTAAPMIGGIRITGNRVNIRTGPGINYSIIDCVDKGTAYPDGNPDGWRAVMIGGKLGWVSPKYSEVVN